MWFGCVEWEEGSELLRGCVDGFRLGFGGMEVGSDWDVTLVGGVDEAWGWEREWGM